MEIIVPRDANNMAEKEQFKKYAAAMAQKRQTKVERKKLAKGKERILPTKLTIQRLVAQVKGSSQKYVRMGPLKRVEILEDDLCKAASIEAIRRACIAGFNLTDMSCDILESERGPSIESVDNIKNLNGTIFVRLLIRHSLCLILKLMNYPKLIFYVPTEKSLNWYENVHLLIAAPQK